jgi:hypothetical protein
MMHGQQNIKDNKFFINVDKYQKAKDFIFSAVKSSDLSSFSLHRIRKDLNSLLPLLSAYKWGQSSRNSG